MSSDAPDANQPITPPLDDAMTVVPADHDAPEFVDTDVVPSSAIAVNLSLFHMTFTHGFVALKVRAVHVAPLSVEVCAMAELYWTVQSVIPSYASPCAALLTLPMVLQVNPVVEYITSEKPFPAFATIPVDVATDHGKYLDGIAVDPHCQAMPSCVLAHSEPPNT